MNGWTESKIIYYENGRKQTVENKIRFVLFGLIILLTCRVSGQSNGTLGSVSVSSKVTYNSVTQIYSFNYSVTNPSSSTGRIDDFEIDISRPSGSQMLDTIGLAFVDPLTMKITRRDYLSLYGQISSVSFSSSPYDWTGGISNELMALWFTPSDTMILPGGSLSGFVMQSKGLPAIRISRVEPFLDIDQFPSIDTLSADGAADSVMRVIDSLRSVLPKYIKTIGPTNVPTPFDSLKFLDTLKSYSSQSLSLGWINNQTTVNKYSAFFDSVKAQISRGAGQFARITLDTVIANAKRDSGGALSSEAYALLRFNSDFLKSHLPTVTLNITLATGWNMVSVPDEVSDFRKTTLYTQANSSAFAYVGGGYHSKDTLTNGPSYWVKFPSNPSAVNFKGLRIDSLSIPVAVGWNMVGSISSNIATTKIIPSTSGMITSYYYGYNGGYSSADTLKWGRGYWVKSNTTGTLILKTNSTANTPGSNSTEQPPEAPIPPGQPEQFLPLLGDIGLGSSASFSWGGEQSTGPYHLQVATSSNFASPAYDNASIAAMSQTVGSFSNNTTYYWRVCEANMFGEGSWSETWSFTTSSGMVLTYTNSGGHPQLSWTVPSGITYAYKVYRHDCDCGTDCGGSGSLIASVNSTTYTDQGVQIAGKNDPCSSTSWYYVKGTLSGTSTLSGPSNKVSVNNKNISWAQSHRDEGQESIKPLPTEIAIFSNYPNPFNPTTTIYYTLPQDQYVKLVVYNVLGQEVARLVDGVESAGYKTASFDASNLQSGVYFYRFNAGNFKAVKKMLLLK